MKRQSKEKLHMFQGKTLKPKLVWITFKNSARTAKKTQLFTITKINWLTLFKEIIAVHIQNPQIQNAELPIVEAAGTYIQLPLRFKGLKWGTEHVYWQ
jgi:hypothetical protein